MSNFRKLIGDPVSESTNKQALPSFTYSQFHIVFVRHPKKRLSTIGSMSHMTDTEVWHSLKKEKIENLPKLRVQGDRKEPLKKKKIRKRIGNKDEEEKIKKDERERV
ncbi:hypothetical protein RhiirA4_489612 [Rhizophagus irregularis]|uniref:Uncharacterized protein n=1 Tax=Rhizophagus irregularis TaxID=588596 RepID=A0A2I1HUX5_9GLOM|nr:hypothetical protein RhiirA4_489612 [Rhizophagus irregularis]